MFTILKNYFYCFLEHQVIPPDVLYELPPPLVLLFDPPTEFADPEHVNEAEDMIIQVADERNLSFLIFFFTCVLFIFYLFLGNPNEDRLQNDLTDPLACRQH